MKIYFTNEAKKQWFNLEFIRIIPRPKQPQLRKKQYLCDTETSNAMKVTIILLTILVAGGAIVWLIDRLFYHKDMHEKVDETEENGTGNTSRQGCADEACGLRSICGRRSSTMTTRSSMRLQVAALTTSPTRRWNNGAMCSTPCNQPTCWVGDRVSSIAD